MEPSRMVALSNRVYTLLLHAYPAPFRREYGREMAQVFRDDMRGTLQESGPIALIGLWLLILFDLIKTAFAEHIREVFHMPIEKITRWSGPAAAFGGILFFMGIIWFFGDNSVPDNSNILFKITFLISGALSCLGLFGLYRRLSQKSGWLNILFFIVAISGLILYYAGFFFDVSFASFSFFFIIIGTAGMGFISLVTKALGKWSIGPLLLALFALSLIIVGPLVNYAGPWLTFSLALYAIGWVLLGIGLMQSQEDQVDPAFVA